MKYDIYQLLKDYGIRYSTEGKNVSLGWINMRCPFCNDHSDHLGFNLHKGYFHCWRCANHGLDETLSELLNVAEHEVWIILRRYELRPAQAAEKRDADGRRGATPRPSSIIVPGEPLQKIHRDYLVGRGYDPDLLARTWRLTGTGPFGPFRFRVVYPLYSDGRIVSFQGRDVTGRAEKRWKMCPKELELVDRNHILGGIQLATGDSCVIVEGATSAWRLGPGAIWPLGTAFVLAQVNLMRRFRRRFVMLDSRAKDPNAAVRAEKLANMLSGFNGETIFVELDTGDPGDLPQSEADYLMKHWGIRK